MSVRLSDYGIDENEFIPAEPEPWPEKQWPENPYQAMADAQVRAGAWPGTPLLLEAANCYAGASQGPDEESPQDLLASHPWEFLFEFSAPLRGKSGCNSSSLESTADDIDAIEPQESSDTGCGSTAQFTEGDSSSSRGGWKRSHRCVPRATDLFARYGQPPHQCRRGRPQLLQGAPITGASASSSSSRVEVQDPGEVTTLMIRHIPNMYTRSMLVEELESLGLGGLYDFLYLPIDTSTQWNVGYAFVNFIAAVSATKCVSAMTDYVFRCFEHNSGKVTQVAVAHIQGLERNLEHYSNTAVQCVGSQDNRPLVLAEGHLGPLETTSRGSGPRRRRRQRPGRLRQGGTDSAGEARPLAERMVLDELDSERASHDTVGAGEAPRVDEGPRGEGEPGAPGVDDLLLPPWAW